MTKVQEVFLSVLRDAIADDQNQQTIRDKKQSDTYQLTAKEWSDFFMLAESQHILPLICDHLLSALVSANIPVEDKKTFKNKAIQYAMRQIVQTNEFLTLLLHAQEQGLNPIVLKGIICRELYAKPMLRLSVDEDLLILPEQTEQYHNFFISEGMFVDDEGDDRMRAAASELSYHKENSPLYIELHKNLFEPGSDVFGDFNLLFPDIYTRTIEIKIQDVLVRTLDPSDHLLYLILHAFKHFVHSGIGIRAICDIGKFSTAYADQINWTQVQLDLEKAHAFVFAQALFRIVRDYLLPEEGAVVPWSFNNIDTEPLLQDILAGGVHGNASLTRLHSSNITLQAVSNHKKNQDAKKGTLRRMLFPPAKKLESRYPYLKKSPVLLPVAWIQRGAHYLSERRNSSTVSDAAESIRLGEQRIKLLEQYGIIK